MFKRLLLTVLLFAAFGTPALASNCASYPYTLTNGSTADANQVMANFNSILNCGNNNLAHNGANSDITSLSGLTTPLSVAQGGTGSATTPGGLTNLGAGAAAVEALGNNVIDDGSGNLTQTHGAKVFTSSGTFTTPATTTTATVFKIVAAGGGGGGGGVQSGVSERGASGGSGGYGVGYFSGFSASQSVTIAIGASGSAGSTSGGSGGDGGTTTVTANAVAILTATGGTGGTGGASEDDLVTPPGSATVTAGASGLTLVGSYTSGGGYGGTAIYFLPGGSNPIGVGGTLQRPSGSGSLAGTNGINGGGGGGAANFGSGAGRAGGSGGKGIVTIEW